MKPEDMSDDDLIETFEHGDSFGWSDRVVKRLRRIYAERSRHDEAAHRYQIFSRHSGEGAIQYIEIDRIQCDSSRRDLNPRRVAEIAESIRLVGLLSPPIVTHRDGVVIDGEEIDGVPVLVAGRHRVEAMRSLGHRSVACIVVSVDKVDAELIEIAENLHRSELTALQRDEQVARWIELAKTKREIEAATELDPEDGSILRQPDAKPGRPEGGVRAASRELGLSEPDARRAVKVASLSPEAKAVAVDAGLANNRSALLDAAREKKPERQVEVLKSRLTKAEAKIADKEYDRSIEAGRRQAAETACDQAQTRASFAEADKTRLAQEVEALRDELATARETIAALERELSALRSQTALAA